MTNQIISTKVFEDGSCASVLMNINGKFVASNYVAGMKKTHIVQNKRHTNRLSASMKLIAEKELQKVLDNQSLEWHDLHAAMYQL
ncbi:MAG TPA: hypothetical protein VFM18_22645 [Methanosarcina sp.]|nr:hypothetical protein [Methanosarcina sp.]